MAMFQLEDLISQKYLPLSVHHNRDAGRMARSHRPVLSAPWRRITSRGLPILQPWLNSKRMRIPRTFRRQETIPFNTLLVVCSSSYPSDHVGRATSQEDP